MSAMTAAISFAAGLVFAALVLSGDSGSPQQTSKPQERGRLAGRYLDDQCLIDAWANGSRFTFLIDTGADRVFFSTLHSKALGYDPARLPTDHTFTNWIGSVRGADVRLREFRLGTFVLNDVEAAIDQSGDTQPLLGMSVLKRLHMRVDTSNCVLSW